MTILGRKDKDMSNMTDKEKELEILSRTLGVDFEEIKKKKEKENKEG